MTATHDEQISDGVPVFIWFGVPQVGREHVLMVVVNDPQHGLTYRPMMYVSQDQHDRFAPLAARAAEELGVAAVLREYSCNAVLDRLGPPL